MYMDCYNPYIRVCLDAWMNYQSINQSAKIVYVITLGRYNIYHVANELPNQRAANF